MELVAKGIVVVTDSGEEEIDVCETTICRSAVICVDAHVYDDCTCKKNVWWGSGYGECIDLWAPGDAILSANFISNYSE